MLEVQTPAEQAILNLISRHPNVLVAGDTIGGGLTFRQGSWNRSISVNDENCEVRGLVELIDNNPMVCADAVSIPGPFETLALIALGPCAKAQLMLESPIVISNVAPEGDFLTVCFGDLGWNGGFTVATDTSNEIKVVALTAMIKIATPPDPTVIDALFEECYERSFFIRSIDKNSSPPSVEGSPFAFYSLSIAGDEQESLLRVQVVADPNGKCGAAQIVHAMNVMAGFEESLPFSS